ncbi:MAG: efflux RND transporter permease subunit, partial [Gammaproteobacteria bacterium]|nr:efflux RND transporter permease subunit [Gammaproteobacteria bacterium]
DPDALRATGLSGNDVTAAIGSQNSILPAGTQKIGDREYFVTVNANPRTVAELNDIPITTRNGSVIYVRDVAHVRDGSPPQTNIVRRDGHRGVLMSVLFQLPRNSRIMSAVSAAAITASRTTPAMAARTNSDWSPTRSTLKPCGS